MSRINHHFIMRLSVLLYSLISSALLFGQDHEQPLIVTQNVLANRISNQQASTSLIAYNQIQSLGSAHYQAGQYIILQPGFDAQAGSAFEASIGAVVLPSSESRLWVRAYPNPFTEQTQLEYNLPLGISVEHRLLDAKGQLVRSRQEPVDQVAGLHQLTVQTGNLPAGVYLYQIQAGSQTRTVRLIKKL